MSYGTFHTFIKPNQRYGMIFGGSFKGMQMDIDRLMRQSVANNNDLPTLKNFIQAQGSRQSANEHLIPEQLFDNPDTTEKEVEGVSAVKALQIASQQGQKIFNITAKNKDKVLPQLSHGYDVMQDIKNALNAGKEVQIHEKGISYKGWSGTGYIILDPLTGAGAYLIGGGIDGGFILVMFGIIALAISLFFILSVIATGGLLVIGLISMMIWVSAFQKFLDIGNKASKLVKDNKIEEADNLVNKNVMILALTAIGGGIFKAIQLNPVLKLLIFDMLLFVFKKL